MDASLWSIVSLSSLFFFYTWGCSNDATLGNANHNPYSHQAMQVLTNSIMMGEAYYSMIEPKTPCRILSYKNILLALLNQ
jgi:hypothetical protein